MALDALAVAIQGRRVNWVLDADISGFFDSLNHQWLMKFIEHRIADRHLLRQVRKWLKAGVLEAGQLHVQEEGTPQGGSLSPLLANIYLHYVLDLWTGQWRRKHARGDVVIVRYADDFVVGFEHQTDARRFLQELRERFHRFNLELQEEKTRILEFGRRAAEERRKRGEGRPMTFNFLGFTHACDKTRRGRFIVLRRTVAKRMRAKLRELKQLLRERLHEPVGQVGAWLASVLRGHFGYYGVPRNYTSLDAFRRAVRWLWRHSLNRRSQKGHTTGPQMDRLSARWLPTARICHPYPQVRLCVMIQGKSPVR
jgi:group II intron reverse transcriptase/maturase